MPKHIVIFSHGFGVRKDSRGMFTDIIAALSPGTEKILFDYNEWNDASQTLTVGTMDEWVKKLQNVIAETHTKNPDAIIDLICHSQGCVVAGLAKPTGLRKIILIGPPAVLTPERMKRFFEQYPNTHIDFNKTSTLHRRDGSTTLVPPAYWQSIRDVDPVVLYNGLAESAKVVMIHAGQDEVVDNPDPTQLDKRIKQISLDGDHNFKDEARIKLVHEIAGETAQIPIVNEDDVVISYKFPEEVGGEDIHRATGLWIINSRGDFLLGQRAFTKRYNPGAWGPPVAGTVEKGETYESNVIKEAEEELGLKNIKPRELSKRLVKYPGNSYFAGRFTLTLDKPAEEFDYDHNEIAQLRWFTREEFERGLRERPDEFLDMLSVLVEL